MTEIKQQSGQGTFIWGPWATLGWVIIALLVSGIVAIIPIIVLRPEAITDNAALLKDGLTLSISTLVSLPVQVGVLAFAARRTGWPIGEYLGLVKPKRADTIVAFAVLVVFLVAFDAMTYVLGREIVTPFQVDTYTSARAQGTLVLLWLTLVVGAPLGEELMFRGFLFRGWVSAARKAWPGILGISALFAIIHQQYDWFGVTQIFLIGLILAWARWQSGSILLTMAMHALINLWATLETVAQVDWLS